MFHKSTFYIPNSYFLLAAELGLSFLAHILRRAINMVGIRKLIEAM
jgi:hypothetical protein